MARAARTSGPSMGPLHVQLYTERLPTLLRCSGHQETSGSNAAVYGSEKRGNCRHFARCRHDLLRSKKRGGDGVTFAEQSAAVSVSQALGRIRQTFAVVTRGKS